MNDSNFDDVLRQRHAEAVTHLSTHAQVQLRNRLAASAAAPVHLVRHRMAWATGIACAALFALAIGLQWRPQPMPAAAPSSVVVDDSQADASDPYAGLDENPDLYLWLASSDAIALASE